jgi:hypothetical protein
MIWCAGKNLQVDWTPWSWCPYTPQRVGVETRMGFGIQKSWLKDVDIFSYCFTFLTIQYLANKSGSFIYKVKYYEEANKLTAQTCLLCVYSKKYFEKFGRQKQKLPLTTGKNVHHLYQRSVQIYPFLPQTHVFSVLYKIGDMFDPVHMTDKCWSLW